MTYKYKISGLVQGIGFRPDVKRLAEEYGIGGYVKNSGGIAEVAACGDENSIERFKNEILKLPNARITSFEEETASGEYAGFEIVKSSNETLSVPMLTPDIATCDRCMEEFYDSSNRRFMHPFISCTVCGPRYSVQSDVPYDRCNITLSDFEMCDECKREYGEICNIRCHAQTIACNGCGPVLTYTAEGEPLKEAVRTIKSGGIVAVKDIGGYHFACDAKNEKAVKRLREIKRRDTKPFAVMFNTAGEAKEYAFADGKETETLLSSARPIVLIRKKRELAPSVCGKSDYVGAFLPCNPVQHYLTKQCGALVMTSANVSGEPIITENADMLKLREKTGGFEILSHDRRILTPLDDSVCRVICGRVQMIRRARGYTPLPIEIEPKTDKTVLALGGDLKASFCWSKDGRAYMSQYFGDLENSDAYGAWRENIGRVGGLLGLKADITVKDMHPLYISAMRDDGVTLGHHYAHMASVMAEHKLCGNTLGFIFDGTGYGEDGNIWGGEVIFYDGAFHREASLEYTELLGGDASAKDSSVTRDCYLIGAGLGASGENGEVIEAAVKNHINTAKSSSMGRLFDAVSALLDISGFNSYEGESAILLENAAARAVKAYPLTLGMKEGKWQTDQLIRDIYNAYHGGSDKSSLALGFHHAVANAVIEYAKERGEKNIILSGGVFANRILTEMCFNALSKMGYNVYINEQVPMNDGGIALGQAWYVLNKDNSVKGR